MTATVAALRQVERDTSAFADVVRRDTADVDRPRYASR